MKRTILVLILSVAAIALIAGTWKQGHTGGESCQKLNPGSCCTALIESDLADIVLDTQGIEFYLSFDADEDGATAGTTVDIYSCKHRDDPQANCLPYEWDTDGDGIVDNNTLNGSTAMMRGVEGAHVPFLLVDPTAHVQDAQIVACGVRQ
jgi:hypothetical protein